MKPGTVFKWNNFPYPQFPGEIKARWFIYLGDSGPLTDPVVLYFCTTTTLVSDFEKGGRKSSHRFLPLDKTKCPFGQDCILDFDEPCYSEQKILLESNKNIEKRGKLSSQFLREIYNGILQSKQYQRIILLDIHNSLNQIGITGLKKP